MHTMHSQCHITLFISLKQHAQAETTKEFSFWIMISKKNLRKSSERSDSSWFSEEQVSESNKRMRLRKQQGSEGLVQYQDEIWSEKKKLQSVYSITKPSHEKSSIDLSGIRNENLSQGSVIISSKPSYDVYHSLLSTKECMFKESGKTKGHSSNDCVSHETVLTP